MENLLGRVKNIILSPRSEWQTIKMEQATVKDIVFSYIAPLAAIPVVASVIGMGLVGLSFMGSTMRYPFSYLIPWSILNYVLSIVGVLVSGAVINTLAETFESRKDSIQALKVAAYSFTPAWIASILNAVPVLGPLALLASLYGIYLLYLGLRPLMETPENKAVGYTVASIITIIIVVIVVNVIVSAISSLFFLPRGFMMPMPE